MTCINHLRNCFHGETQSIVHEAATTSSRYHHPKLHTSYWVKISLMLVLMILIFPQLPIVISDQSHTSYWVIMSLMLVLMILIFPQLSNCVILTNDICDMPFWWVGLVTQLDVEQSDVKVQFMFTHGPSKTFNWPELKIHAMCQSKTFSVRYLLLPQQLDELVR